MADLADENPWRRRLREAARRQDRPALEELAKEKGTWSQPTTNLELLAIALRNANSEAAGEQLLRRAQQDHPADFWINFDLANVLSSKKTPDLAEAVGCCRAAVALRPQSAAVWRNLGVYLGAQKRDAEAKAAFRNAIALKPNDANTFCYLGNRLKRQEKLSEAEAAYRKAVDLKPDYVDAYQNLGGIFASQEKWPEAEAAFLHLA